MFSAELQIAVSFSLVLGAIFGALLVPTCGSDETACCPARPHFRLAWNCARSSNAAASASGRRPLRSASHAHRCPGPSGRPPGAGRTRPRRSPAGWNMIRRCRRRIFPTWRRGAALKSRRPWPSRCPQPPPGETELVAPVRRRTRGADRPAAIDARIAQEIVLRHFGVAMNPLSGQPPPAPI